MSLREIKKYPAKVLAKRASEVGDPLGASMQRLIDDMVETMYAAKGVGLAAPQVGVSHRLIVLDTSAMQDEQGGLIVLINPELAVLNGSVQSEEGCLSLPGFTTMVDRAETVTVCGLDREGAEQSIEAEGLLAIALQHEIDHLEGTLILDRTSFLKREFFKKQLKKQKNLSRTP